MIKAVIFDFGKVIYKTDWNKANEIFLQKNGFNVIASGTKDEELIRIYKESDVGKEDFKKFFKRLNPEINDIDQIVEDYKEAYSKSKILNKEMLEIVESLKDEEIRLFGFTDTKKEHYEANLEAGLYKNFEDMFKSFELGNLKSEKEAFDKVIEELGELDIKPSECIFIDDHEKNIENAKDKGFNAIHYTEFPSTHSFKKELNEILNEGN